MDRIPGRRPDDIKADIRSRIEDHLTKLDILRKDAYKNLPWEKSGEQFERVLDTALENNFVVNRRYESKWFILLIKNVYADENETVILYELYAKSLIQKVLYWFFRIFFPDDKERIEYFKKPLLPIPGFIDDFLAYINADITGLREYFDRRFDVFEERDTWDNHGLPANIIFCTLETGIGKYYPIYSKSRFQDNRMDGTVAFPALPQSIRDNGRILLCILRNEIELMKEKRFFEPARNFAGDPGVNLDSEKAYYDGIIERTPPGIKNIIPILRKPDPKYLRISLPCLDYSPLPFSLYSFYP